MNNLKLKAIEYFAAKPHDDVKAKAFFKKEYEEIQNVLSKSNSYRAISSVIDVLEKFISHVADKAIEDLVRCWERLHITEELIISETYFSKYHTKDELYAKIIGLLSRLRYIDQEKVVAILFEFWKEEETQRGDVEKVFKELAEFNLYAVEQIGFTPQVKLLHAIMHLTDGDRLKFFPIITSVFSQILSTDIEGHSWNYRTVSIESMAIPATEEIKKLRQDTVSSLIQMYQITNKLEHKKELLNVMNSACRVWSRVQVSDDTRLIVENNTIEMLQYWSTLIKSESLELVQIIENDSYWNYYHAISDFVKQAALSVKTSIDSNEEYQIYRDLVGYEGIFGNWEDRNDYDKQNNIREKLVNRHIDSVNQDNISDWLNRVELYLETDSRDLATFPELFKFVEVISNRFPNEVLFRFEETNRLDKSVIPIFKGIWGSSIHDSFIKTVSDWIDSAKYLWELSVVFLNFNDVKLKLIEKFVEKAILVEDLHSLSSFLRIFEVNQECLTDEVSNQIFEKIFTLFNQKKHTIWINHVWFSRKGQSFIQTLSKNNIRLMIDNLVFANNVDHRVEGVLEHIAHINISDVFYFFEQRIEHKKHRDRDQEERYDDIPFSLHSINKILAEHPEDLILLIKRNYEYGYGIDQYGVAGIFKKCFSPFKSQLIDSILEQLNPSIDEELKLILAIASSYKGHSSILPLIKQLLMELEYSEEKISWVNNSLREIGVIRGEYGLADAYKNKLSDIEPWLNDNNANVVKFAYQYTDLLKEMIEDEINQMDEQVALEKHKFGIGE